jgi:hypothetical protein
VDICGPVIANPDVAKYGSNEELQQIVKSFLSDFNTSFFVGKLCEFFNGKQTLQTRIGLEIFTQIDLPVPARGGRSSRASRISRSHTKEEYSLTRKSSVRQRAPLSVRGAVKRVSEAIRRG